jgi:hypothetical protein
MMETPAFSSLMVTELQFLLDVLVVVCDPRAERSALTIMSLQTATPWSIYEITANPGEPPPLQHEGIREACDMALSAVSLWNALAKRAELISSAFSGSLFPRPVYHSR